MPIVPFLVQAAPAIIGAAGSVIGAHQQSQAAQGAANATEVRPYSGTSPYGSSMFDPASRTFDITQADNPFARMFQTGGLTNLANAATAPGAAFYGAHPDLIAAMNAAGNTDAETQDRLGFLRSMAQPGNDAAAVSLKDKLFSLGQLGSTSGAAGQEAMLRAQNAQDLGFQTTAADWANQRAQQRFTNAFNTVNQGASAAQNQFNMGEASSNQLAQMFQQLLGQANVGLGAGGGQNAGAAMAAAGASGTPFAAGMAGLQQVLPGILSSFGGGGGSSAPFNPASLPVSSTSPNSSGSWYG